MSNNQAEKPQIEKAEELWDKYSQHIDDNVSSFESVAGASVITRSDFMKAMQSIALSLSEKEEIKAYKKQISELQSKLFDEKRRNCKVPEKEEEWISVETKLPTAGLDVLVSDIESDIVTTGWHIEPEGWFTNVIGVTVTHWRKLPQGPKSK